MFLCMFNFHSIMFILALNLAIYSTNNAMLYIKVSWYFLMPLLYHGAVTGFGKSCSFLFLFGFFSFFLYLFFSLVLLVSPCVKNIIDVVLAVSTSLLPAEP